MCRAGAGIAVVECRIESLRDVTKLSMVPAGTQKYVLFTVLCVVCLKGSPFLYKVLEIFSVFITIFKVSGVI